MHDKLNVLGLQARVVDLLVIILFLFLVLGSLDGLALAVIVTLMVVARVVVAGSLLCGELLSSIGLRGGVQVLNLSLAEDAARLSVTQWRGCHGENTHVRVAGWRLVDIGLVDDEKNLDLVSAEI